MNHVAAEGPSLGRIARQGAIAVIIALVINLILFYIGSALGAFPPEAVTPVGEPVGLVAIVMAHVIPGILAIAGYFALNRFLTRQQADRWFTILAVVVLIAAIYNPFTITNPPVLQIVILEVMHVVLGGALVYFLRQA